MRKQSGPNHKPEQMASALMRAVQQIIARGLQDPRVSGLITVTNVRVTPDLAEAFISVSVYPEDREKLTLHGLESAKAFIRREAGDLIKSRSIPAFVFRLDRSLKVQAGVLQDINRAMEATRASEASREAEGDRPGDGKTPEDSTR